ncbi:MAG TPA: hypothetical protein PK216_10770, partial [Aquimonas sp.]|nr:hypothetical protein [Aquimonas sp.]
MKATLVTLLLSSFVITPVLAECGPEVPASSFYGYSSRDGNGRCKTLEEVEAQVHAAFSPTMEYAFWIPSDFSVSSTVSGTFDYRPYGALSPDSSVLRQPASTVSTAYKLYTKGWPPTNVHANCATAAAACPGGTCPSAAALSAFVKCQFDNTWNLNATSSRPAFCWARQSEPVTTVAFGTPTVVGAGGSSGALTYTPPSSTSSTWGAKISINAGTCDGLPAHIDSETEIAALEAVVTWDWNIDKREDMTCPAGSAIAGGASSTGSACVVPFGKVLVGQPPFTQTPGTCSGEGNPCFPSNGNKQVHETGFRYGEIALDLHYNSMRLTRPFSYIDRNWSHTLAKRILTEWAAPGHMSSAETRPIAEVSAIYVQNERAELEVFKHRAPLTGVFQSTESVGVLLNYIAAVGSTPPRWELSRGSGVREIYDRAGRLVQIIDPDPAKTLTLSYMLNELTPGVAPTGNGNHLTEVFWRIERVTDGRGRYVQFEYSGNPYYWLDRIVSNTGTPLLTMEYDNAHRLTRLEFADASAREYLYNEAENIFVGGTAPAGIIGYWLTGVLDERGQRYSTYRYDDWGRVISSWHGADHGRVDVSYVSDQSSTVTYALGNTKTIIYKASEPYRHKLSETDLSGTRYYQYDPVSHRLTQIEDARGSITKLQYDSNNARVTRRTEALGTPEQRRIETDWDSVSSQMLARRVYRDPGNTGAGVLEEQVAYTYDPASRNLLTRTQTDPVTGNIRRSSYTYCSASDVANGASTGCAFVAQLRMEDGPRTDVVDTTTYSYRLANDAGCASNGVCNYRKGDLWKRTNALGQVTEYVRYDSAGRVTRLKDANGVLTDMTYHLRGWLQTSTVRVDPTGVPNAGDAVTILDYYDGGLVSRVTAPDGVYLDYIYDAAQRLTRITDSLGNRIDYTLDASGHRTAENTRDPAGQLKRTLGRIYNELGQLDLAIDANLAETDHSYDANGNLTDIIDPLSTHTRQEYDPLNRLKKTIQDYDANLANGLNVSTEYSYDAQDRLRTVTDPKGLVTTYTFDGLGNLTELASPDTDTTSYTYDAAGNRLTQTDARGVVTSYTYDALNRLRTQSNSSDSEVLTHVYDISGANGVCTQNSYGVGRLARETDALGSVSYCYDARGNLLEKIRSSQLEPTASLAPNELRYRVAYRYTLANQLAAVIYPDGDELRYTRNSAGQITQVVYASKQSNGSFLTETVLQSAQYAPFGPLTQLNFGNGSQWTRALDQNYAIDAISSAALNLDATLDDVGNFTGLNSSGQSYQFGYDPLYRLTDLIQGSSVLE